MPLKRLVNRVANYFGYTVIPTWRLENREFAIHLREIFNFLSIDCVLDVGANEGQYYDFLRSEVGYSGLVVSFEPIPELAAKLQNNAKGDPRWKVFPYALGAEDSAQLINVTERTQFTSFLEPDHTQVTDYSGKNIVAKRISVNVKRLDGLITELRQQYAFKRVYMKLDTQGYDLEVIKGAKDALDLVAGLQTEASVLGIYSGMPDYMTSIRYLSDLGFDMSGIFPVSRDRMHRLVEFDCVMISKKWAAQNFQMERDI